MAAPDAILFTPLRRISLPQGDVRHALKASDTGFAGFGEAYFSAVASGSIKGWKRHRRMVMNLIVPCGAVQFSLRRDGETCDFVLSADRDEQYGRLTVPPDWWMAFGGVGEGLNLVLNIASIEHDPAEAETCPLETMPWAWR